MKVDRGRVQAVDALVQFLSRNVCSSPEGAAENSPGREPGVRIRKLESPEGATLKPIRGMDCAGPSGLRFVITLMPSSRPGLLSDDPPGLSVEFRERN
jgi:hypothetical protein